jgi:non-catalytic primase subunit PriX-like protein
MLRFEIKYKDNLNANPQNITEIDWIESLYKKSLDDFRKYCTWRIFIPYFINVKKLSRSQVFNLVNGWLNKCNSECKRLDFNSKQKINDSLNNVKKYRPVSKDRLKIEDEPLYFRLKKEGILS